MSKYYLSLCCIIKDERYLEEFIVYYNILGVEHFYIYDNESSLPISKRLDKPYFQKICTIINIKGQIQQLNSTSNSALLTWPIFISMTFSFTLKFQGSLFTFVSNLTLIFLSKTIFGISFEI